MKSTPALAYGTIVSNVMPPDDSVSHWWFTISTAFLVSSGVKLSNIMRSGFSARACSSSSKLRTSTSILRSLPFSLQYCLARDTALCMPPAKSMWLSLSSIMSKSPMRWFIPPPIFTASFSSIRIPGVVLRVSSTRVLVPASISACWYLWVIVAMPLMRCIMLSIRRSVCNRLCTLPLTIIATSPFFTSAPSFISTSTSSVGSKRRNTSLATSMPASMPSSFTSRRLLPIASAGMQLSVVWSPSPISSAKLRSMSLSVSSFTVCWYNWL